MSKANTKTSMKAALGASLSAERDVFKDRMAMAEARFASASDNPSSESGGEVTLDTPAAAAQAKVIREAFTIPENEHGQIEAVRSRLLAQAVAVSKSEILRAGLALLGHLNDEELVATVAKLERVKTGRPKTV